MKVIVRAGEWYPVADLDEDIDGYPDKGCIEVTPEEFAEYKRLGDLVQAMSADFLARRKRKERGE